MRDLTKDELNVLITCLDSAKEDEGAKVETIDKLLELFEMELVLLKPRLRKPAIRKESK